MFCPSCGQLINGSPKFCTTCGSPVSAAFQPAHNRIPAQNTYAPQPPPYGASPIVLQHNYIISSVFTILLGIISIGFIGAIYGGVKSLEAYLNSKQSGTRPPGYLAIFITTSICAFVSIWFLIFVSNINR